MIARFLRLVSTVRQGDLTDSESLSPCPWLTERENRMRIDPTGIPCWRQHFARQG